MISKRRVYRSRIGREHTFVESAKISPAHLFGRIFIGDRVRPCRDSLLWAGSTRFQGEDRNRTGQVVTGKGIRSLCGHGQRGGVAATVASLVARLSAEI